MIVAYRHGKLSVLQPVLCTSYVFTLLLSWFLLFESITLMRLMGVVLISLGVIFLSGGDQ